MILRALTRAREFLRARRRRLDALHLWPALLVETRGCVRCFVEATDMHLAASEAWAAPDGWDAPSWWLGSDEGCAPHNWLRAQGALPDDFAGRLDAVTSHAPSCTRRWRVLRTKRD